MPCRPRDADAATFAAQDTGSTCTATQPEMLSTSGGMASKPVIAYGSNRRAGPLDTNDVAFKALGAGAAGHHAPHSG